MAHPSHQAKKPIDAKDYWMGIGIALGAGVGMIFGTLACSEDDPERHADGDAHRQVAKHSKRTRK
jgi:hypothetical protein